MISINKNEEEHTQVKKMVNSKPKEVYILAMMKYLNRRRAVEVIRLERGFFSESVTYT